MAIDKHGTAHMKVIHNETRGNNITEKKLPIAAVDSVTSPGNKGFEFSIPSSSHEGFPFSTVNFSSRNGDSGSVDQGDTANPFVFRSQSQQDSPGEYLI